MRGSREPEVWPSRQQSSRSNYQLARDAEDKDFNSIMVTAQETIRNPGLQKLVSSTNDRKTRWRRSLTIHRDLRNQLTAMCKPHLDHNSNYLLQN
jgi:hypothetical protein